MSTIPSRETWLYKNKESLSTVLNGLDDAQTGKVKKFDINSLK